MPEKRDAAAGWPMLKGEYRAGDSKSCVAVVTCGSHLNDEALVNAGAAVSGSCKTENLGIEKLVTHIVSNPNIRYLIVSGAEVKGHITGEAILMLHKNGISNNRIVGAKGAIPYVENLSSAAVDRFREQIECINMINVEDVDLIAKKIRECIQTDPGAFSKPALLLDPKEGEEDDSKTDGTNSEENTADGKTMPATGPIGIENMSALMMTMRLKAVDQKVAGIGDYNKFQAGYNAGRIEGFVIGFVAVLIILGLLILIL
ncbi:tetrahydromethanopterin S-methyltransferase subunit A [Methanolapillus millepedarum]|uniref:Tetrahydromethanopterin S-methyltransferase subunit A n=1 Tax=Methanolapillus millepedarum TaxID=3028296 RepID=A0AA96V563_9EURY|nr:hypothetical protein MsAc7_13310 [Methanosarcinaceae archaeon Ac7]